MVSHIPYMDMHLITFPQVMDEIDDDLPPDDDFAALPEDDDGPPHGHPAKKQKCSPYKNAKAPMTEKLMKKCRPPLKPDELKEEFGCRANMLLVEVFSPPRLQTHGITEHGMDHEKLLSIDVMTGWDLSQPQVRKFLLLSLPVWTPRAIMLSPPCTIFSRLQNLNKAKADADFWACKQAEGLVFWKLSLQVAEHQLNTGGLFALEHPKSATSWQLACTCKFLKKFEKQLFSINFDQCVLGLKSKVWQVPCQKRTTIVTNCCALSKALEGCLCDGSHEHQVLMGSEGGCSRAAWAAQYPPALIAKLVESFMA